jgi:hypothetical protein
MRFPFRIVLLAVLPAALVLPAHAQQMETLWNCRDKDGRTILTNQQSDTAGKECRVVHQQRVTVVPGVAAPKSAAKSPSPAGFPKESPADRASSKAKQRDTLEKELVQEQGMLADARKKLSEQEAIRTGDEKNYARVLERLKPFRDSVEVHEKNVEALKREIGNLNR